MIQQCIECDKPFHLNKGDIRVLCAECAVQWLEELRKDPDYKNPSPLEELIKKKEASAGASAKGHGKRPDSTGDSSAKRKKP